MKVRYFSLTMLLAAIVVVLEITLFFFDRSRHFAPESEMILRVTGAFCLVVGLWLQSNFVRVCGGIFLAVTSVGAAWAIVTISRVPWSQLIFWLFYVLVGLFGAYLLLVSSKFATEFRYLRQTRPKYKVVLARIFLSAVILVAAIAVLHDIYCLAGNGCVGEGDPSLRVR